MTLDKFKTKNKVFIEKMHDYERKLEGYNTIHSDGTIRADIKVFPKNGDMCMMLNGVLIPTVKVSYTQKPCRPLMVTVKILPTSIEFLESEPVKLDVV